MIDSVSEKDVCKARTQSLKLSRALTDAPNASTLLGIHSGTETFTTEAVSKFRLSVPMRTETELVGGLGGPAVQHITRSWHANNSTSVRNEVHGSVHSTYLA